MCKRVWKRRMLTPLTIFDETMYGRRGDFKLIITSFKYIQKGKSFIIFVWSRILKRIKMKIILKINYMSINYQDMYSQIVEKA